MSGQKQALFAIALAVVACGLWVRGECRARSGVDLKPRPDALEYALAARSFAEHGCLALQIGAASYPPRYPPGFPLLAAPIVWLQGGDLSRAWRAALAYGLLGLLLACLLGHLLEGLTGALCAGLILALSPEAVSSSVTLMSETASLALWAAVLLLLCLTARARGGAPRAPILLGAGLLLGVAVTVRYTNLALLLPALLFLGTRHRFAPPAPLRAALLVLLPALLGAGAVLAYNQAAFGDPLRDGYRFWAPPVYDNPGLVFSPRYLLHGLQGYWESGHLFAYGRALLGLDASLWTPWIAALAALGAVRTLVRSRFCPVARLWALAACTAAPALLLFHLAYVWQSIRFLTPLLLLVAVLAGAGAKALAAGAARLIPGRARTAAAAALVLAVAAAALPLGRPLLASIFPESRIPPLPALLESLPGLDAQLERPALVIVNFPVTLAVPALGRGREILVNDAAAADPHLNFIHLYRLQGKGGATPGIKSLSIGKELQEEGLRHVLLYAAEGRPVYYVYCAGEAPGGAGIEELGRRARLIEAIARPPLTVFRVEARE
ncbi:MAG: glycosyltransferase family 39 protein [Planctomycetes bacterium]|nr:glycosyltransferase family 39 protein [Planctomycetota bacterium]